MSRTKLNLTLLAGVVVLAAVVWRLAHPPHAPGPPALVPGLAPASISRVHIHARGEPDITLNREAGEWRMSAPYRTAANKVQAETVAALAAAESQASFPAAGRDLHKFGLAAPVARVELNGTAIRLGATEPISGRRYAEVGGSIHLIPDFYTANVTAAPAAFVSLALLPAGRTPVSFSLPQVTIRRGARGRWTAAGVDGAAASAQLADFVEHWRRARALDVEAAGGAASQGTVTVGMDAGGPIVFDIVSRSPELILVRRDLGTAYHFPAAAAGRLLQIAPPAVPAGPKPAPHA